MAYRSAAGPAAHRQGLTSTSLQCAAWLVRLPDRPRHAHPGGEEILVLHGTLHEGPKAYPHGSWLRLPPGRYSDFAAGGAGTTLYLKIGRQEAGGMALEPS